MTKTKEVRSDIAIPPDDSMWVRDHIHLLEPLLESNNTFQFDEYQIKTQKVPRLNEVGIIREVGKDQNCVKEWTLTNLGYKIIKQWSENRESFDSPWPCGCATTGVKNPRGTDKIECPKCGMKCDPEMVDL